MFNKIYAKNSLKTLSSFSSKNFNAPHIRSYYVASPENNDEASSIKTNIPIEIKLNLDDANKESKYLSLNIAVHLTNKVDPNAISPKQKISLDVFEKTSSLMPVSMFNKTQGNINANPISENPHFSNGFQGV